MDLLLIAKAGGIFLSVFAAGIGLLAAFRRWRTEVKRRALVDAEFSEKFLKQFNDKEISRALSGYVIPHCSPGDPTHKEGEEFLADTREPIFDYMDRNIENVERSYHLLLADTGMGKTTFCLNYFSHVRRKYPDINICIVSLASAGYEGIIKNIINKSNTVLLADAFDEDSKGWGRGRDHLAALLEMAADFKSVIITCRSQYFLSDDVIPRETPLPVLVPRQLGQSPTFSLVRSYISPFSKSEIAQYIAQHFPLLYIWRRGSRLRALSLVRSVPDLAHRPMLLERLPELARTPATSKELYDLYGLLVDGWLVRESRWIPKEKLRQVSTELALQMYEKFGERVGRLSPEEIEHIAKTRIGESPDWTHLTSRSLLNRDSKGNYKFAHKSILEFLVVKAACEGDDRSLASAWTPFMKELFVSWGHSEAGKDKANRAREILASAEGRRSIAPLFDMLRNSSVRGIPNFRVAAERRLTVTGERLAPASWRASSIDVFRDENRGLVIVRDLEFNLNWAYMPMPVMDEDLEPVTIAQVLRYMGAQPQYRLPSYEQFLTLVEGLYRANKEVIPARRMFLIEDKPARHEHIIVQINSDVMEHELVRCIDKQRKVGDTEIYVNTYLTGLQMSPSYATSIFVEQLYLEESDGDLFEGLERVEPRPLPKRGHRDKRGLLGSSRASRRRFL